jgi:hypothetical protein
MSADPAGTLSTEESRELSNQWRALRRAATAVALLTSPALRLALQDPGARQLVAIQTQSTNANFQGVVVVKADNATQLDQQFGRDDTAVFLFCGSPKTCKIDEGSPTVARGTVLRREALELALYTFEYAHPIDNVLIFFPPGKGEKSLTSTLFFQRDDLKSSLKHPLRRTLPQVDPPLPGQIRPAEMKTVNELTGDKRYKYLGTSQNVIVIQPPA